MLLRDRLQDFILVVLVTMAVLSIFDGYLTHSRYSPWSTYQDLGTWKNCSLVVNIDQSVHVVCNEGEVSMLPRKN